MSGAGVSNGPAEQTAASAARGAASAGIVDGPLPAGFECSGCLYELGGLDARVCPECGRAVVPADFRASRERAFARDQVGGLLAFQALLGAAICLVMGAGAGVPQWEFGAGAAAAAACALALGGSVATGWVASRFVRPVERNVWFAVWLRTHLWLHAPWLVAPLTGGILLAAGYFDVLPGAALVGLAVWACGVLLTLVVWVRKFGAQQRRLGLRGGAVMILAALFILGGAALLGFASGALSLSIVARLGFFSTSFGGVP